MKRGMLLPFRHDAVPLRFGDNLIRANLPIVPKIFGHVNRDQPPVQGGWGNVGNRTAGDCTIAEAAHDTQTWCWASGKPIPPFTDASGLADYSRALVAQGGPPFDPNNPATDTGLDPVALASWRQTVGITDAAGGNHKIGPFASVTDPDELDLACYMFVAAGMYWNLPDSAEGQFEHGEVWDDTSGPGTGGHATSYVGRNSAGNREFITWGGLQAASDAYVVKYFVGGLGFLSQELMRGDVSPDGINWAQLSAYLESLKG